MKEIQKTDNYKVIEVATGVYAVITEFMLAHGYCNSAIVDLGDKCIVFDTLGSPETAKDLILLAKELTQKSTIYLIDSHWHWDHVWGNQSFEGPVFTTIKTREILVNQNQNEIEGFKNSLPGFLERAEKEYKEGINGMSLFGFQYDDIEIFKQHISSIRHLHDSLDDIDLRLPDFTFEKRMQIWGADRHVELLAFHGLHSQSDVVMYIPDTKTLVGGDLVVSDLLPFSYGEDPLNYGSIFENLLNLDVEGVIPGHGSVTDKNVLPILLDYWTECHMAAKVAVESNNQEEYISTLKRPEKIPRSFVGEDKTFQAAVTRFVKFGLMK